jgi:alpha-D-ribose 1-methylphosphonate 5-triphosphate synthase subunit PhnI
MGSILRAISQVLKSKVPTYDYENRIFDLILKLAGLGQRDGALEMTANLQQGHPKVLELFDKLNKMQ